MKAFMRRIQLAAAILVAGSFADPVINQAQFQNAIHSGSTVWLGANILLSSPLTINSVTELTIKGQGFSVNGQNHVQCIVISGKSSVTIEDLYIVNGLRSNNSTAGFGGGGVSMISSKVFLVLARCVFAGNKLSAIVLGEAV